jgi:hypothetical protein
MMHKYIPDMTGVKLVLREGDRFTVIDMALLEEWRKPSAEEKKQYEEQRAINGDANVMPLKKGMFSPSEMQRIFLRMLMAITELRNKDLPESLGDELVDQIANPVLDDQAATALSTDTNSESASDGEAGAAPAPSRRHTACESGPIDLLRPGPAQRLHRHRRVGMRQPRELRRRAGPQDRPQERRGENLAADGLRAERAAGS